jgi:uncharacterized protein YjbI with pentapeptide repeats
MLTKNLTPYLFGAKLVSRRPPELEVAFIVRGSFTLAPGATMAAITGLGQGHLTAELFHDDDDERRGACLYGGDLSDFKPNAEVLLEGACYPPKGSATECGVRFVVGSWSKDLWVVGPRVWRDGLLGGAFSEPLPFSRMPLTWQNAFGGAELAENPVGKGYRSDELPNVESPRELLRSRSDRPSPAGYGPINPAWPPRAGKIGKNYGASYRETRAPFYSDDFDFTYFNAAPPDQQLAGYLRGDEELAFHNLHPKAPVFSARLPARRIRAFVKDTRGSFREIRMSLDTLFANVDEGVVRLTWRGVGPALERDLSDLAYALIAEEPLGERPLPEAHYRVLMKELEDDPTGIKAMLPPGFDDMVSRQAKRDAGEIAAPEPSLDPISAVLAQRLGTLAANEQAEVRKAVAQLFAHTPAEADLGGQIAKALAGEEKRAEAVAPVPFVRRPGAIPDIGLRRTMRLVAEKAAETRQKLSAQHDIPKEQLARLEALEQVPHDPRWKQIDPSYEPPEPLSTDEPGPGADLRDHDLSFHDLRGRDLRGARLEGAILTGAKLAGADLRGANLRGAVLYKADLGGADLSGADLRRCNAAKLVARGVNLRGADLGDAFFEGADLTFAILERATGEYTVFAKALLDGAKASEASFRSADFKAASLGGADLRGATLLSCLFGSVRAPKVDLTGALLTGASFSGADLSGAILFRARAERCLLLRAKLEGADLTYSIFTSSHFTEVSAARARFCYANLRESRFYRAQLERADFQGANLFHADLCKAHMNEARFRNASLYGAALLEAAGTRVDFEGANLGRSTLERA